MLSKLIVVLYRPREPFEIAALTLCLLAVIVQMIDGPTPGSAAAAMPAFFQLAWAALVGGGSFLTLLGVFLWHRALSGIMMEAIGLAGVAAGLALNGAGAIFLAITGGIDSRAALTGPLSLSWAWAAYVRMRRVKREIHELEHECAAKKAAHS